MAVQQELDPLFVEALYLLHSKASDSCEQLKRLLDEALHHTTPTSVIQGHSPLFIKDKENPLSAKIQAPLYKKGSPKHFQDGSERLLNTSAPKSASPGPQAQANASKLTSKVEAALKSESGSEKKPHEKSIKSTSESSHSEAKKLKLDVSSFATSKTAEIPKLKIETESEVSFSQEENTSATDLALEMGLACVVCRSIQVASGNTLVECQDCHNLYHQECHKPPITDQDVNDPRLVWYCAKCTKTMKKMVSKSSKNVKPVTAGTTKESSVNVKPVKQEPAPVQSNNNTTHIFKRIEPKMTSTTSNNSSSGNKPIGWAGLAASLSGKTLPSQKTSQAATSSKPTVSISISKPSSNSGDSGKSTPTPTSSKPNPFPSLFTTTTKPSRGNGNGNGGNRESSSSSSSKSSGGSSGTSTLIASSKASSSSSTSSTSSGNNGSSSSSSASSSGSKSAGSSSLMSADKRLQIMKKKAAAKMQEKRRLSNK